MYRYSQPQGVDLNQLASLAELQTLAAEKPTMGERVIGQLGAVGQGVSNYMTQRDQIKAQLAQEQQKKEERQYEQQIETAKTKLREGVPLSQEESGLLDIPFNAPGFDLGTGTYKQPVKPEAVNMRDYEAIDTKTGTSHKYTKIFDKQGNVIRVEDNGVAFHVPQRPFGMTPAQSDAQDRLEANDALRQMQYQIYDIDPKTGNITGFKPDAEQIAMEWQQQYAGNHHFQKLTNPTLKLIRQHKSMPQKTNFNPADYYTP